MSDSLRSLSTDFEWLSLKASVEACGRFISKIPKKNRVYKAVMYRVIDINGTVWVDCGLLNGSKNMVLYSFLMRSGADEKQVHTLYNRHKSKGKKDFAIKVLKSKGSFGPDVFGEALFLRVEDGKDGGIFVVIVSVPFFYMCVCVSVCLRMCVCVVVVVVVCVYVCGGGLV